jgi:hypothetical protein
MCVLFTLPLPFFFLVRIKERVIASSTLYTNLVNELLTTTTTTTTKESPHVLWSCIKLRKTPSFIFEILRAIEMCVVHKSHILSKELIRLWMRVCVCVCV